MPFEDESRIRSVLACRVTCHRTNEFIRVVKENAEADSNPILSRDVVQSGWVFKLYSQEHVFLNCVSVCVDTCADNTCNNLVSQN